MLKRNLEQSPIIQHFFAKEAQMKHVFFSCLAASALLAANITFNDAPQNPVRFSPNPHQIISYHDSIATAKKSVVNIATTKQTRVSNDFENFFNDPFFKDFFGGFNFHFGTPNAPQTRKTSSLGSGVVISADGYIVTNFHVIDGAEEILVTLLDNSREFKAKLIGSDSKTDIAIIKIDGEFSPIAFADSSNALEGDVVFAIGNPFGVGGSVTSGIISALNKDNIGLNQYEDFIQTDASINPGNSGGALVDSRGALVGINSAIVSRSGGNNGVGFAIPSNMVKEIAQKLIADGKIVRGYIGVSIASLTKDQREVYKNQQGALITNVEDGSAAQAAKLRRGDLIIEANGAKITSANDLKNVIGSLAPNSKIRVKFERGGEVLATDVVLGTMQGGTLPDGSAQLDGLTLRNLTDELRGKFGIAKDVSGVLITEADKSAAKLGFKRGDVIIQVNQKEIKDIAELNREISKSRAENRPPLIWINRANHAMAFVLK